MQNSGLGNAINPLLSLCDLDIYSIPMLLIVGWRGQPGVKDAIQHYKDGRIQEKLLDTLELPYEIISGKKTDFIKIKKMVRLAKEESCPVVILVQKDSLMPYENKERSLNITEFKREQALKVVLSELPENYFTVCSTGKISREVYEVRERLGMDHNRDFLNVGSMGHSSSIALGISLGEPSSHVVCIDGDGSLIMHMGNLATMAKIAPPNIHYILINNFVHESVGGQETASKYIDMSKLAASCKFYKYYFTSDETNLKRQFHQYINDPFSFLEIVVCPGSRSDLGRPKLELNTLKNHFMSSIIDSK